MEFTFDRAKLMMQYQERKDKMDSIQKIKENYHSLTKSEKKLADYIVSNQDTIIHNTMSELRQLLSIGDATVIRLCKKLGFSGFTDLKVSIAKENINIKEASFENNALLGDINSSLQRTYQLTNEDDLNHVVTSIRESNNILIFGRGQSGMSAIDLEKLLLSVGIHSKAVTDSDFQINGATAMKKGDLLIVFSLTGRTSELIDSMKIAKNNSAKIIAITNYLLSPVAKLSDFVLQSSYDEFISSSVPGRISQMYISGLITDLYESKYHADDILNIRETALRTIISKRVDE